MAQNWVLVLALSKQNAVPDGLGSVHQSVSVSSATREAAPRKLSNFMPIARTRTKCFIAVSSFAARFVSKLLAGLTTEASTALKASSNTSQRLEMCRTLHHPGHRRSDRKPTQEFRSTRSLLIHRLGRLGHWSSRHRPCHPYRLYRQAHPVDPVVLEHLRDLGCREHLVCLGHLVGQRDLVAQDHPWDRGLSHKQRAKAKHQLSG
jgi:hypothetical protein